MRAHVFLCTLADVERHLRQALAPLLFHGTDLEAVRAERTSPGPFPTPRPSMAPAVRHPPLVDHRSPRPSTVRGRKDRERNRAFARRAARDELRRSLRSISALSSATLCACHHVPTIAFTLYSAASSKTPYNCPSPLPLVAASLTCTARQRDWQRPSALLPQRLPSGPLPRPSPVHIQPNIQPAQASYLACGETSPPLGFC
jgi:hypothetical protein